jgi:hypothetical protein
LEAGVISVEVLEEKWTMEGENPKVTITIKAKVNIPALKGGDIYFLPRIEL